MKISEVIQKLAEFKEKHGDVEVIIWGDNYGDTQCPVTKLEYQKMQGYIEGVELT